MGFKVGQIVEVIDNNDMVADLGATAVVTGINKPFDCIDVKWKTHYNEQMGGGYQRYHFKPKFIGGQQLVFSFVK